MFRSGLNRAVERNVEPIRPAQEHGPPACKLNICVPQKVKKRTISDL